MLIYMHIMCRIYAAPAVKGLIEVLMILDVSYLVWSW